jgi:hypothetical protein
MGGNWRRTTKRPSCWPICTTKRTLIVSVSGVLVSRARFVCSAMSDSAAFLSSCPASRRRPYLNTLRRNIPTVGAFYSKEEEYLLELGGLQTGKAATHRADAARLLNFLRNEIMIPHPELFGVPTPLWDTQLQWSFTTLVTRLYVAVDLASCVCWFVLCERVVGWLRVQLRTSFPRRSM